MPRCCQAAQPFDSIHEGFSSRAILRQPHPAGQASPSLLLDEGLESLAAMPSRGAASRAPSGPWGRLKPVDEDALESMGLPSRGDGRLLDAKTQEKYYTSIVERYMTACSDAGRRDELLRRFSSLAVGAPAPRTATGAGAGTGAADPGGGGGGSDTDPDPDPDPGPGADSDADDGAKTAALAEVLAALRRLREAIVASGRADDFAAQAYLFCIRVSVLAKQPSSYQPAMLHLLRALHPRHPLTSVELREVAAYLVLDTACRRRQLAEAYALRLRYGLGDDAKLGAALAALAHDNPLLFRRAKRGVDGHRASIMDWAEPDLRRHALKCVAKSYLSVDVAFLERLTASTWHDLTRAHGVGWELDRGVVTVRRPRAS